MADKKLKRKALEDLIIPKVESPEPEDNEQLSEQDKILLRDFHRKAQNNELKPSRQKTEELIKSGEAQDILDERGFYNTRKLIDSGKIGGKDVEKLFKKVKKDKSNPI